MNKVTIRLSHEDMELVRRLGGGKLTDGVRQALRMAQDVDAAIARLENQIAQVDNKVTRIGKMLIAGAQQQAQQ